MFVIAVVLQYLLRVGSSIVQVCRKISLILAILINIHNCFSQWAGSAYAKPMVMEDKE